MDQNYVADVARMQASQLDVALRSHERAGTMPERLAAALADAEVQRAYREEQKNAPKYRLACLVSILILHRI